MRQKDKCIYYNIQILTKMYLQSLREEGKAMNAIYIIEGKVYQRINKLQSHQQSIIKHKQQLLQKERKRLSEISQKSVKEIVTHPYNQGNWVCLAGFINTPNNQDIEDIEKRMFERRKVRQSMEVQRQEKEVRKCRQQELKDDHHKPIDNKISWRLMRELRRKEVEENKSRLQKLRQNQIDKMGKYHKY